MSNPIILLPISLLKILMISNHVDPSKYLHIVDLVDIDVLLQLRKRTKVFSHWGSVHGCSANTRLLRIAALAHPLLYKHQLTIPELQAMTVLHNNFHKTICLKSVLLKVRLGIEP